KQMVEWLDADIIEDRSRAVDLNIDVRIPKRSRKLDILEIVASANKKKQIIAIFRRTKLDVHSLAKALLQSGTVPEISDIAKQEIKNGLKDLKIDNKSRIDYELEEFYLKGIGIHHADIHGKYKAFCEKMVKDKHIPIIICTTTLGLGVNLPIDIAVISEPRLGQDSMTPSTFIQIAGRAGRSGLSKSGESVIFVSKERDKEYWEGVRDEKVPLDLPVSIRERKPREITEHILRLVDTGFFKTWDNIKELERNLFSTYVSDNKKRTKINVPSYSPGLFSKVSRSQNTDVFDAIGNQLFKYKLVTETENNLLLTGLGRLALRYKLEPTTVNDLVNYLTSEELHSSTIHEVITRLVNILEVYVYPSPLVERKCDVPTVSTLDECGIYFQTYFPQSRTDRVSYDAVACAMLFRWLEKEKKHKLCDVFGVWPTSFDYVRRLLTGLLGGFSGWVLLEKEDVEQSAILHLYSEQIKHGIPEELVPLAEIPYIGRVTAEQINEILKSTKTPVTEEIIQNKLAAVALRDRDITIPEIIRVWKPDTSPLEQIKKRHERENRIKQTILKILKDEEETRDFECKEQLLLTDKKTKETLAKQVAAFANNSGGFLIIGVTDELPRKITGINPRDYGREQFSQVIEDWIKPSYDSYEYTIINVNHDKILVLEIHQHDYTEPLKIKTNNLIPFRKDSRTVFIALDEYKRLKSVS
ncbi:MAG: RNA-binding domain-containing protein, partial [Candidatus Odinarchaeota archaeon]